jgi:phosphoglucosamine mutase
MEAVEEAEGRLGGLGRVNVRPSGTEPVVRVMVEAKEGAEEVARKLADLVSRLDRE